MLRDEAVLNILASLNCAFIIIFPNKLVTKVPNKFMRNLPLFIYLFIYFASLLTVPLIVFINKPHSPKDLTIFIISLISSFGIINIVTKDYNIFFWIAASVADAAAFNPNDIRTLLANVLSRLLIKGSSSFNNNHQVLPKNYPDCPNLCNRFFDYFILAEELFAKSLRSFENCALFNNNF